MSSLLPRQIVSTPANHPDPTRRMAVHSTGVGAANASTDATAAGSINQAIYAYPIEHYAFWQTVRAQAGQQAWGDAMPHGMLGEHLTLSGLLEADAYVGDQIRLPDCTLAISEPYLPDANINARLGFSQASKLMGQSGYCGFYLSVIQPGTVAAGESYELIAGPRETSIRELFRAQMNRQTRSLG